MQNVSEQVQIRVFDWLGGEEVVRLKGDAVLKVWGTGGIELALTKGEILHDAC